MSASEAEPQGRPKRFRLLVVALVVVTVVMVAISVTLTILFTVPLVTTERTGVSWFDWKGTTANYSSNPGPSYTDYVFDGGFCGPPSGENFSLSFVWQSTMDNTSGTAYYQTQNSDLQTTDHWLYWVNNTTAGGYSFPTSLLSFFCNEGFIVWCWWSSPSPGAVITMTVESSHNYTATVPIW